MMLHIPQSIFAFLKGPNAASIEDQLELLAGRCRDSSDECNRLFHRLYGRFRRLHRLFEGRCSAQDLWRPLIGLHLLERLARRFLALVDKHKSKHLLVRFATKRSLLGELEELHRESDELFALLGLADDWRSDWTQDREHMHKELGARVEKPHMAIAGLENAQIVEALAVIKYEVDFHSDGYTVAQLKFMRRVFLKVVTCSRVKVPRIPKFFIPPMDVELGEHHEEIQDTSSTCVVTRGVWDRETSLVAQYLSVDSNYAKSLFLRATETWYGLEHQNVVKMLGASPLISQAFVVWEDVAACGNFLRYFSDESHQGHVWRKFLQVAHGLNYMHEQGRTHGNLKCAHILVAEDETPKICHFELTREAGTGEVDRWKSPEYNLGNGPDPSKAGDVYAFGLCIIEARTGEIPYPFECDDDVVNHLKEHSFYPRPEGMRDDEWDVIKQFCAHNPRDRPSMAQAIELVGGLAWKEALEEECGMKKN
ncbi:hypothetical protein PHYBOEH_010486 [Phytophthora boehmeriae]|uniref:Protein kinase domain-containing protein n=1 Tax=Phytophthora boehmeriae TaxID=109152 RepID=A0A8T1VQ71_9STRA|nr:hypothetical protein PHYBOEH_010486 [Phytophthora boehmeriae]